MGFLISDNAKKEKIMHLCLLQCFEKRRFHKGKFSVILEQNYQNGKKSLYKMVVPLSVFSVKGHRAIIRLIWIEGVKPYESHRKMVWRCDNDNILATARIRLDLQLGQNLRDVTTHLSFLDNRDVIVLKC